MKNECDSENGMLNERIAQIAWNMQLWFRLFTLRTGPSNSFKRDFSLCHTDAFPHFDIYAFYHNKRSAPEKMSSTKLNPLNLISICVHMSESVRLIRFAWGRNFNLNTHRHFIAFEMQYSRVANLHYMICGVEKKRCEIIEMVSFYIWRQELQSSWCA